MDILGTFNFVNIKGLIGAVVFITAAFLIYKWWDKRKKKKAEAEEKALTQAETPQIETVMPLADSAPSGYTCKCGAGPFILKEMRKHLMDLARKEKGKHGWAGKPSKAVAIAASALPTSIAQKKDVAMVSAFGKYAAYVWEPNPGIIPCKITKPVGNIWLAEPTLPKAGACYFCVRDKNNNLIPYDPRLTKLVPDDSTESLFRFIDASEVVNPVYTSLSTLWEKISTMAPYVICALIILAIIVKVGG